MWRSEACKTFWLIHQHRCWEWPAGKSRLFMGRSSPVSPPTSDDHSWTKIWTRLRLDWVWGTQVMSWPLGIQVMKANQFLSCFRCVWHVDLAHRMESEHERAGKLCLWTSVDIQDRYLEGFLKSAWKYRSRKACHYFLLCSTKRRCCSFSMSAKTGSKSTESDMLLAPVFRTVW